MTVPEEKCIDELLRIAEKLGKSPTIAEFRDEETAVSSFKIRESLGSWNKAKAAAGLEVYDEREDGTLSNREWLNGIKDGLECLNCGESFNGCLDFHHLDEDNKSESVSSMINRRSKEDVLDEIEKCVILCANCHRKAHSKKHDFNVQQGEYG